MNLRPSEHRIVARLYDGPDRVAFCRCGLRFAGSFEDSIARAKAHRARLREREAVADGKA